MKFGDSRGDVHPAFTAVVTVLLRFGVERIENESLSLMVLFLPQESQSNGRNFTTEKPRLG